MQKTVINILKLRFGWCLFLFDIRYLKILLICKKKQKKTCFYKKNWSSKNLKIKFQQRSAKPKYSIDKKATIL